MSAQLITTFYECFQRRDYEGMAACYHPEATFKDEAFDLKGQEEIGAMWTSLIKAGKDLSLSFSDVQAEGQQGSARWIAAYTFSRTGRRVVNHIQANFVFKDGLIYRHRDTFSFWRWSRQALGLTGWLLGWTPWLQKQVRQTAMSGLRKYMARAAES